MAGPAAGGIRDGITTRVRAYDRKWGRGKFVYNYYYPGCFVKYYERMEEENREEGKNEGELRARRLAKFKM